MDDHRIDRVQIQERLVKIIQRLAGNDRTVDRSTSLLDDLDIDSLTFVQLDLAIQSEIGLALTVEDVEKIVTVDDLLSALCERGQPV